VFVGGNQVDLLQGGDELFPRMCAAIDAALHEVWLATYIFHDDTAAQAVADA
jgi:cardiolipin synthase